MRLTCLWAIGLLLPFLSSAQTATRFSIVIDELFPDPAPSIGLPNSEFVELKNVSSTPFNLKNWKLSDGTSTATIAVNFILQPDSFVIICPNSAVPTFAVFGNTIGVSNFPSLNNDEDVIVLYSPGGTSIHSVAYAGNWYKNDVKTDGGWTLEMIDTHNPCGGSNNWKASNEGTGGTPGKKNSVDGINEDEIPPALIRTYSVDSFTLVAVFDEPVDSLSGAIVTNYSMDNGIGNPLSAVPVAPVFKEVLMRFASPLHARSIYTITANNITDCTGNNIGLLNTAKAGIPLLADSVDIIINELLFNPKAGGYDYIELYNRSNKVVDLKQLLMANRNNTGNLSNIKALSTASYLFFPGEYLAFTENSTWLQQNYMLKDIGRVIQLPSLPSLPDDQGAIVITTIQGNVVDEVHYTEKWHFALIDNDEGVALERISYNEPGQEKANWTSAASTTGYGTPAYQNSQFRADLQSSALITIAPAVFSPDNNGFDDFASIQYRVTDPGYVANITVFDAAGRTVRRLARNATLALSGNFRWDGLDDNLQKLPVGVYIVLTEVFNLQGKTKKFKNVVTLARRF
jgi:Lamin Tail Domain